MGGGEVGTAGTGVDGSFSRRQRTAISDSIDGRLDSAAALLLSVASIFQIKTCIDQKAGLTGPPLQFDIFEI